jgi:hypothetical protein
MWKVLVAALCIVACASSSSRQSERKSEAVVVPWPDSGSFSQCGNVPAQRCGAGVDCPQLFGVGTVTNTCNSHGADSLGSVVVGDSETQMTWIYQCCVPGSIVDDEEGDQTSASFKVCTPVPFAMTPCGKAGKFGCAACNLSPSVADECVLSVSGSCMAINYCSADANGDCNTQ